MHGNAKYRGDYIGQRFGKLVVIGYPANRDGSRRGGAVCKCDCGNIKHVGTIGDLIKGNVTMCGPCGWKLNGEKHKHLPHSHGKYYEYNQERLYMVWQGMLQRGKATMGPYADVSVCDEWHDYLAFREWALSTGYDKDAPRGKCTIDRINPFGNYEPSNCRWVDMLTQRRNKRAGWLKAHPDYQPA